MPQKGLAADDPRDFVGRCQFRIDGHGEPQLVSVKIGVPGIVDIADAGDGVPCPEEMRGQASQDVQFIGIGDGDKNIGVAGPHLPQRGIGGAVAAIAEDVQRVADGGDHGGVGVHDGDRTIVLGKLAGQCDADPAGADDMNVDFAFFLHGTPLLMGEIGEERRPAPPVPIL